MGEGSGESGERIREQWNRECCSSVSCRECRDFEGCNGEGEQSRAGTPQPRLQHGAALEVPQAPSSR